MEPPLIYGSEKPDVVLVGWGSNYGVMKESVDALSSDHSIAMMHFTELYPLPEEGRRGFMDTIRDAKTAICIENNATGRFAQLLRMETGYKFERSIRKYDGRPFTLEGLLEEIDGHLSGVQGTEAGVVPGMR
jgi:2-oxoglutarate ferredoxin oxidoreductase subunit alpha